MAWTQQGVQRTNVLVNLPAPTSGVNDIDPISQMSADYALSMRNWIPSQTHIETRKGYKEWVTGIGSPISTILNFAPMGGIEEVFAATGTDIFNVTTSTDTPVSDFSINTPYLHYVQLTNIGGSFLVAAGSGGQPVLLYDGVAWKNFTEVAVPSAPAEITGVQPSKLSHVALYARRLWFVEEDSMTAWYLPTDAVGGEAKPFFLGGVFQRGGRLTETIAWSLNAGNGVTTKIVFRSSMGEVAVYSGSDPDAAPDEAGSFALEGIYYLSPPVGKKSSVLLGGDILLLSKIGLVSLSSVVSGKAQLTEYDAQVTRNISRTLSGLANNPSAAPDWEIFVITKSNTLAITIPSGVDLTPAQYMMNTINGAWGTTDMPAVCFGQTSSKIFFGTKAGNVYEYGNVSLDNVLLDGSGGENVNAFMFQAFSYFDSPQQLKSMKLVRPVMQSDASEIKFALTVFMDFQLNQFGALPDSPDYITDAAFWDDALWDVGLWTDLDTTVMPWVGVSGLGYSAAVLMKVSTNTTIKLSAIQVVYDRAASI